MTQPLQYGSEPERLVYEDLLGRGYVEGVTFIYQQPFFGTSSREKGTAIIDFLILEPPGLGINVQGEYFHYEQGAATIAGDRLIKAQLAAQGVTLVFIDAEDVVDDVEYYVTAALNFQDLSSAN